jgi:hypothetical protein
MAIEKQLYERQMELIFRMLLENKTNEQIASELKISIRSVQNYKRRLEQRYMAYQREKTDSTLFLEVNLLKTRLLKLYRCLEDKVTDPETGPSDTARCADTAADIAIQIIKLESEGIRAVKELGLVEKAAAVANKNTTTSSLNNNNNLRTDKNDNDGNDESFKECDPNRKF